MPAAVIATRIADASGQKPAMSGKRKRDLTNGEVDHDAGGIITQNQAPQVLHSWLKEAFQVLQGHDPSSSILETTLTGTDPIVTRSPKRPKLSQTSPTSIAQKVTNNTYKSIDELFSDLDRTVGTLGSEAQVNGISSHDSASEPRKQLASRLKDTLRSLVSTELMQRPRSTVFKDEQTSSEQQPDETEATRPVPVADKKRSVLTLFGGERNAKQLFSNAIEVDDSDDTSAEKSLPNGITLTNLLPMHSANEKAKEKPTLGQRFPPASHLAKLEAPKPMKQTTRGSSIGWINPREVPKASKESNAKTTWFKQPLTASQWLDYHTNSQTTQHSATSKRRHKERALSTNEPPTIQSEEESRALAHAKEESMFRSAYSSFAPSQDNYGAIVPTEIKNRAWWTRQGDLDFADLFSGRDAKKLSSDELREPEETQSEIDERLLEEGIKDWDSIKDDESPFGFAAKNASKVSQNADDLVAEISDLLETLQSHQRVRSLTQATHTRNLQSSKEPLATVPVDASTPSTAEIDVYNSTQSLLTKVVSSLPPSILAKLDGDKLEPLSLSSKIKVPSKQQKGVLDDNGFHPKPKPAQEHYPSSYPAASRTGLAATPSQGYSNRYNYNQSSSQRPLNPAQSYGQYGSRSATGSSSSNRPSYTGGGGQYSSSRPPASYTDRFSANTGASPSYNQYSSSSGYRPSYTPSASGGGSTMRYQLNTPGTQSFRKTYNNYSSTGQGGYNYTPQQQQQQQGQQGQQGQPRASPVQGQASSYHQYTGRFNSHSPNPATAGNNPAPAAPVMNGAAAGNSANSAPVPTPAPARTEGEGEAVKQDPVPVAEAAAQAAEAGKPSDATANTTADQRT